MRVSPYLVTEIEDSTHRVLYQRTAPPPARIIATSVNRDLMAMLNGVIVEGTGRAAALPGREAAGKTGTTQDYRDAWFVGFTPDFVAGVWVGNDDYSPMRNVTGGTLPAAIWKTVMTAAEEGLPAKRLDGKSSPPPPENVADSDDDNNTSANTEDDDESEQGADKSGHHSFWDWLFGRGESSRPEAQSPPDSSDETAAPPPEAQSNPATSPSAIARAEAEARAREDAPERRDDADTPPVDDNDDEASPPPPRGPYEPPANPVRRYVPPPPPPPSDNDDDNGH